MLLIKNTKKIFFLLLIFIVFLFFYFLTSKNCRTYKVFFAINDLGFNQLSDCYSLYKVKEETKVFLNKNQFFFNILKKIYHSNILYKDLNNFDIFTENRKVYSERNNQTIEGIVSDNNFKNQLNVNFPKIEKEGDTWLRSHGGNYNHKYNISNIIDKKNVSNLKLVWKHTSINQYDLSKHWKANIELNPIVINEKIIFTTPDWKIIALEGDTGKKNLVITIFASTFSSRNSV
jgi:quinoprotein glucose dehydrogenase